jgi:hypothetical protein
MARTEVRRRATADGKPDGLAKLRLVPAFLGDRRGGRPAGFLEESLAILLDGDALQIDLDIARDALPVVERDRDRDQPGYSGAPAFVHRVAVGGKNDVSI